MLLHLSDTSPEPLHAQISRQIRAKILSGEITEGYMLPSIRVMARTQHVSVITIQRAYDDLMHEGLIHSRRSKGFYVSAVTEKRKRAMALDHLRDDIEPVIRNALAAGLSADEINDAVRIILEKRGAK